MMQEKTINYERLVEKALLGVVRGALTFAEKSGLTGKNHFYITFKTKHPDVILSKRLQEAYPDEMTIVLQHEFSGLEVTDALFAVTLSFGDVPERITIPFSAIASFTDPYAQFAMTFKVDLNTTPEHPKKEHFYETEEAVEGNVVSLTAWRKKK